MSKYIGKRVSYPCDGCGKQFTISKKTLETYSTPPQMFCSVGCALKIGDIVWYLTNDYENGGAYPMPYTVTSVGVRVTAENKEEGREFSFQPVSLGVIVHKNKEDCK